jgi:hypothetical protein
MLRRLVTNDDAAEMTCRTVVCFSNVPPMGRFCSSTRRFRARFHAASKQRCPVFQCWDKVAQVLDIRYWVTPAPCGFPRQFLSVTFSPPGLPLCVRHGGVTD